MIHKLTHPWLAMNLAVFLKLLLAGLYLYFIRKKWGIHQRKEKWPFYLLEISMGLIMIPVLVHYGRAHYGILFLPAFVITGLLLYRYWKIFHLKEKALFSIAYFLSGMGIPRELLNILPPHPLWGQEYYGLYLWISLPFYGYLVLGFCILLCYSRFLQISSAR